MRIPVRFYFRREGQLFLNISVFTAETPNKKAAEFLIVENDLCYLAWEDNYDTFFVGYQRWGKGVRKIAEKSLPVDYDLIVGPRWKLPENQWEEVICPACNGKGCDYCDDEGTDVRWYQT